MRQTKEGLVSRIFIISEKEKRDVYEGLLQQQLPDATFQTRMNEADCIVAIGEDAVKNSSQQVQLAQRFNMPIIFMDKDCKVDNRISSILKNKHNHDREHKHGIGYER